MAGYIYNLIDDDNTEFHIGEPNLGEKIRRMNGGKPVLLLQLDCDELDAALWGLDNYQKPHVIIPTIKYAPKEENNDTV